MTKLSKLPVPTNTYSMSEPAFVPQLGNSHYYKSKVNLKNCNYVHTYTFVLLTNHCIIA